MELGTRVQILNEVVCVSFRRNTFGKTITQYVLLPAIVKYDYREKKVLFLKKQ